MYRFKINEIIGHRGCNKALFGNTIEAFRKAVDSGAEMIEFDVRRTRDSVLIVFHDAAVFGRMISDSAFADLDRTARKEGLEIPTLDETLKFLKGKARPDIELKEPGYEAEVVRIALKYFSSSEFIVKSFHDDAVLAVKEAFPDVSAGLLLGTNDDLAIDRKIWPRFLRIIVRKFSEFFPWRRAAACKADFISPSKNLLFLGLLKNAHKRKYPALVWTVNKERELNRIMKTRLVNGIITDDPQIARHTG